MHLQMHFQQYLGNILFTDLINKIYINLGKSISKSYANETFYQVNNNYDL